MMNLQRRQVAYLTDSGAGAIVVVDLAAGTAASSCVTPSPRRRPMRRC